MADPDCKWCGGTGRVRLLTSLVPCDCGTNTTAKQRQIGARISPLGPDRREYAFVAEDSGAWGTRYIWEVYTTRTATLKLLERTEPANGQPDDFYRRFIFEFPFAGDFLVRLLAHCGTDTATNDTRVTVR